MSTPTPGSRLRFRLGRDRRLKASREFALTRETGQRRVCGCLVVNWRPLPEETRSRLGVVTGRRLGNAVIRNRARRLMRTAFRLNQHRLGRPVALILVARASIVGRPLATVDRDLRRCLRECGLWQDAATSTSTAESETTPASAGIRGAVASQPNPCAPSS